MKKTKNKFSEVTKERRKGITLIALVITIIVLLILAGTAITLSINGGNLFSKTNEAANEWNTAVAKEETAIKNVLSVLDDLSPSTVTVTTNFPTGWNDKGQLSKVATAGGRTVPIPAGFVVSEIEGENTIAAGLVIYEGTTAVTTVNHNEAMTTRNQFVWIPVDDINQMVMCKDNNKNEDGTVCNLVLQSDGSLKCMTHHANDNGTELCGRLYRVPSTTSSTSAPYIYEAKMDFTKRDQIWGVPQDNDITWIYHEPDTTPAANYGDASPDGLEGISNILGLETKAIKYDDIQNDWEEELNSNFENMAKSVAKYGGFYVGRYEAGYDDDIYTNFKGQVVMTASTSSANRWYGLYKHLNTTIGGATSIMIWGCQYDQIINFIGTIAQTGHSMWPQANNLNDTLSGTHLDDKMKNIYDLEGNYFEWTAETVSMSRRATRGNYFIQVDLYSRFTSASHRGGDYSVNKGGWFCSRPALYVTM